MIALLWGSLLLDLAPPQRNAVIEWRIANKAPMPLVHGIAALSFGVLGVLALLNLGSNF